MRFVWIIDAGHGDRHHTKGKRSPRWEDGSIYYEGEGNRQIALKVGKELSKLGIQHFFTVAPMDDRDISLKERVEYVNKLPYKNKLGISIHSDAFNDPKAHGWSVYTSKVNTSSDGLATRFFLEAKKMFPNEKFRLDTSDDDPDKEANFYILRKTACPFILLENFFMTNPRECKEILMTEEGQNKIVAYIVNAIKHIEHHGIN